MPGPGSLQRGGEGGSQQFQLAYQLEVNLVVSSIVEVSMNKITLEVVYL